MKKVFALLALFALYTEQCDHHEHDHDHDCDHPAHDDCDHPDHNHGNDKNKDDEHDHEDHEHRTEFGHEQLLGMFEAYDTNGDKILTRDEVIKGAASELKDQSMIGHVERTLDPMISKHDNEGDGLDVEEFLRMAKEVINNDL